MATSEYDPRASVRDNLARYFADNGFPDDGGWNDDWVVLARLGPIPLGFPNTRARKLVIPRHDLHHLATGYATDFIGEAEIGAWELGGSCRQYTVAWVLNMTALAGGGFLAPRRCFRAFVRGRNTRNTYTMDYEPLLDLPLAELRERLEVERATPASGSLGELLSFSALFLGGVLHNALALTVLISPLGLGWIAFGVIRERRDRRRRERST